jgi:hypothetical protein
LSGGEDYEVTYLLFRQTEYEKLVLNEQVDVIGIYDQSRTRSHHIINQRWKQAGHYYKRRAWRITCIPVRTIEYTQLHEK